MKARKKAQQSKASPGVFARGRVTLMNVYHDDWCRAPLGPCTCKPDVTFTVGVSETAYQRSAERQAAHLARIAKQVAS